MKAIQVFEGNGTDPDEGVALAFEVDNYSVASGTGPNEDAVTFEIDMREQPTRVYNNGTILRLQQLEAAGFKVTLSLRTVVLSGGYLTRDVRVFKGVPHDVTSQHVGNRDHNGNALKRCVKVTLCR